jgi:hypothetical protein
MIAARTMSEGSSPPLGAPSRRVDCVEEHMSLTDKQTRERIRELNDAFRKTLDPTLGRMMLTAGVNDLPTDVRAMAIRKVATFDAFNADNDSHGEHWSAPLEVVHPFCWSEDHFGWMESWQGSITSPKRSSPSCGRLKS